MCPYTVDISACCSCCSFTGIFVPNLTNRTTTTPKWGISSPEDILKLPVGLEVGEGAEKQVKVLTRRL